MFQQIVDDLLLYLRSSRVAVLNDGPLRAAPSTTAAFSTYNLVTTAQQAGASSVFVVTVDRPVLQWVKITVDTYGVDGKKVWSEVAQEGGGMTSGGKIEKALETLKTKLNLRLGTDVLPLQ